MTPDYDLSNLHTEQAELWIHLRFDAILVEILADRPERWASPLALGNYTQRCSPHCGCKAAGGTQKHIAGSGLIGVGPGNKEVN